MKRTPLPIAVHDYQRIVRVLASALAGASVRPAHVPTFCCVAGTLILEKHHGLKVEVAAGAAGLVLDASQDLRFVRDAADDATSHAWLKCGGHVIDFSAALLPELVGRPVRRRMLQRPLAAGVDGPDALRRDGDFFLREDAALARRLQLAFFERPENIDLARVCLQWYVRQPKALPGQVALQEAEGGERIVRLQAITLDGVW